MQADPGIPEAAASETSRDALVRQLREQISDAGCALIEALNTRLELVAGLKRYKESRGLGFVDRGREEWMFNYLARANHGPLSPEGLREIYAKILDLTKREIGRSS